MRTAIEAKEFPKFIPMTVCGDGISIGACALPFGTCPLRDILRFYRGRGMRVWAAGVNGGCRVSPTLKIKIILSYLICSLAMHKLVSCAACISGQEARRKCEALMSSSTSTTVTGPRCLANPALCTHSRKPCRAVCRLLLLQ